MWKTATVLCVAVGILSLLVTEIVRSIVDRRRRERDGLGGTQDIAICGMVIGWLCILGAIICGVGWLLTS
jgi:ascorbate-specific PTS system EIIC-type component UlaA